jgi:hypothetical protein
MFSGSSNPLELLNKLSNQWRVLKSKMATAKPEIVVSQLVDKVSPKFWRLPPCFWGPAIQWTHWKNCLTIGGWKSKMATAKPEIVVSQLVDSPMSGTMDLSTIELLCPKMWVYPLKSRFYLVYKLRYKYFRFAGRHLGILLPVGSEKISTQTPTPTTLHLNLKSQLNAL